MRIWHKDLIPVLPKQQLIAQWRECCCIARNIAVNGSPNHLLVNKVLNYPINHLYVYAYLISEECYKRGYLVNWKRFEQWFDYDVDLFVQYDDLFAAWHTPRYMMQCYYNLQEKYDCGGISKDEWFHIVDKMYALYHWKEV